jgi:hypothetical protein
MADLSPSAQAVLDAYETADCDPYKIDPRQAGLAAALRAAVNQIDLLPLDAVALTIEDMIEQRIRTAFLSLANELDPTP